MPEAVPNQREWYDQQYSSPKSGYTRLYSDLPDWAVALNLYHVDFVVALLALSPKEHEILEIGSGRGHYIDAWESRGYKVTGLDISAEAIKASGKSNIVCSPADQIPFEDNSFDVVFSAALLEHIENDLCEKTIHECCRVAKYGAHFIAHEKGTDPSHINIKEPIDWMFWFSSILPRTHIAMMVANPFNKDSPAFITSEKEQAPLAFKINFAKACERAKARQ